MLLNLPILFYMTFTDYQRLRNNFPTRMLVLYLRRLESRPKTPKVCSSLKKIRQKSIDVYLHEILLNLVSTWDQIVFPGQVKKKKCSLIACHDCSWRVFFKILLGHSSLPPSCNTRYFDFKLTDL